jgi:CHASE2 domain-containing sensor protein
MIYQDFDLWIDSNGNNRYLIRAEAHTAARGEFRLDTAAYETLINTAGDVERTSVKTSGEDLFNRIFQEEVGRLYQQCIGRAIDREAGIRLRVRISEERLAEIPWELMLDGKHFLGASTKTAVVRYLPGIMPPLEITAPVNVLVLGPQAMGAVSAAEDIAKTLSGLGPVIAPHFKPSDLTPAAIRDALRERECHIVHFVAGIRQSETGEPRLALDGGVSSDLGAGAFDLFFDGSHPTKLVILHAVAGDALPTASALFPIATGLVSDCVPAVVAFRHPLGDASARVFVRELYRSLCNSDERGRIDSAVACARRSLCQQFQDRIDFIAPALFTRSASGTIFTLPSEKPDLKSVRQLHTAQTVVEVHDANRQLLKQREFKAAPEEKAQIKQEIDAQEAATKPTEDQIRRWRRKVIIRGALLALVIFVACWVGLFGVLNLHDYAERQFMSVMDSSIEKPIAPELRMITIKEGEENRGFDVLRNEDPEWRKNYAKLIRDLADAGAKTIVLDVWFENKQLTDKGTEATALLAAAIDYAQREKHVGVIAAVKTGADGRILTEMPDQLKVLANHVGDVTNLRRQKWSKLIREVRLATASPSISSSGCAAGETTVLPSLPLLAVMDFQGSKQSCLSADQTEIRLRDNSQNLIKVLPVFTRYSRSGETLMVNKLDITPASRISDFGKPIEQIYNDNKALTKPGDYSKSIVVIGVTKQGECFGPDDRDIWCVTDSEPGDRNGKRFGIEIQANVISNLLTGTYINPVSTSVDLLLIAFMVGLGVLFQTVGSKWLTEPIAIPIPFTRTEVPVPVMLLVVTAIYLFLIFIAYQKSRLLFSNAPYHILALVIGYFMMRRMRKRLGLK